MEMGTLDKAIKLKPTKANEMKPASKNNKCSVNQNAFIKLNN